MLHFFLQDPFVNKTTTASSRGDKLFNLCKVLNFGVPAHRWRANDRKGMKRTRLNFLSRHQTTRESLCRQLFTTPYSALIGWCIATGVSIVTWRRQRVCEQGMIRECSATTVTKQNHYLWNAATRAQTHVCGCTRLETPPPPPPPHTCPPPSHPNGCDTELMSFNLQGEMQAESQKWNKMAQLSQQYLSAGNKFRFHYTLCKRQSSALNEMCMIPRWLSDPLDWERGT